MADVIDDCGPAFPIPAGPEPRTNDYFDGMTLRDYLAGQALSGELASQRDEVIYTTKNDQKGLADWCYQMADAMLKAKGS